MLIVFKRFSYFMSLAFLLTFISALPHAGVLPCTTNLNGRLMFLLGQESTGLWADFGGGSNPGETPLATASREFTEETRYVFGKMALGRSIHCHAQPHRRCYNASINYCTSNLLGAVNSAHGYTMHIVQVPFVHSHAANDSLYHAPRVPHDEKIDFTWVDAHDLMETVRHTPSNPIIFRGKRLRDCFANTLRQNEAGIRALLHV